MLSVFRTPAHTQLCKMMVHIEWSASLKVSDRLWTEWADNESSCYHVSKSMLRWSP